MSVEVKDSLRIGLAWQTVASENLGVAALAISNIAILRKAAQLTSVEVSFIEFCSNGPRQSLAQSVGCEIADPMSVKGMLLGRSRHYQQIRECDLIVDIGEGDSFSNIYGLKRLGFLCLSKFLARMAGKRLVLAPQTIGPFVGWTANFMASTAMGWAERVFARDETSMRILSEMVPDQKAVEAIDVAFRLPFTQRQRINDGVVRVGLNVSGLLYHGGYTRDNQFGLACDYRAAITGLIERFLATPGVEVHLVAHVLADTMPVEDDYAVILALKEAYPACVVAPRFESPSDAKSYISGLDFFSGARMHACIGAFSAGVPVVPMAYSRKFGGLFGSLGYKHVADMKQLTTEALIEAVMAGYAQRAVLAGEVAQGNALAQEKLAVYESYLAELFRQIAK